MRGNEMLVDGIYGFDKLRWCYLRYTRMSERIAETTPGTYSAFQFKRVCRRKLYQFPASIISLDPYQFPRMVYANMSHGI